MGEITRGVHRAIREVPRQLLAELLRKKLAPSGHDSDALVAALAAHALSGAKEDFAWHSFGVPDDADLDLSVSEEEWDKLAAARDEFINGVPNLVSEIATSSADMLLQTLRAEWPVRRAYEQQANDEFKKRLAARWGKGLERFALSWLKRLTRSVESRRHGKHRQCISSSNECTLARSRFTGNCSF